MPTNFVPYVDSRSQQFTFPSPFSASVTNASLLSGYVSGTKGDFNNPATVQPVSIKSGVSQSMGARNSTNTFFPKPIDVVALLSGADQFSGRSIETTKPQNVGLPGPMQLFSTLSISDEARKNPNTSVRLNSSIPYSPIEQGDEQNKVLDK